MIYVGCDIGKSYIDISFGGKHSRLKNETLEIEKFVDKCRKHEVEKIVLEPSGGYERKLLQALQENNLPVSVVNTFYVRNFARCEKDLAKTDKIDCKVLEKYGEKMDPKPYVAKEKYRFALEELTSRRNNIVEIIKEERARLEKEPSSFTKESIGRHLAFLKNELKVVEMKIEEIIKLNGSLENEILQSEKGVGLQTSAILIGSLPELGKLDNRQIAKLVGIAPVAHDSGKMKGRRHIRGGREKVRNALFMASISAIKSNEKVRDFYRRLRNKGKPTKVALTAVMRKLLVILNAKMRYFLEGKIPF